MKSSITFVPLLTVAALCLQGSVEALNHHKFKPNHDATTLLKGRYIVELNHHNTLPNFVQTFSQSLDNAHVHEQFSHPIFSGMSFSLNGPSDADAEKLHSLLDSDDVVAIYPSRAVQRPSIQAQPLAADVPYSAEQIQQMMPHSLTQVDRVHSELGNTGKGIVVGVIDSGVDYLHPALGGGFGKGFKVALGEDLVGDAYNGTNAPKRGGPPLDNCGASTGAEGHGTHVSGIIAGHNANFTGVAPDATLGMWRVFGCTGTATDDVIVRALLAASDAGCDLLSLSLGDLSGWSETADAIVAARIVAKGTPVIIAAGNAGADGAFTVGTPSTGPGVFSVASYDNVNNLVNKFTTTGVDMKIEYVPAAPGAIPSGELAIGDNNIGSTVDACSPSTIPDTVKGKYALVKRGSCTFVEKGTNLKSKGAIGMVVYNNAGNTAFGPSAGGVGIGIVGIGQGDGEALAAALKKGTKITITFGSELFVVPVTSGKTVSSFSSVGASYELELKPNAGGPGGYIFSTLPRYLGSWGLMSGTSMATPYVSGSVALYLKSLGKAKRPNPAYIEEVFQNYGYQAPAVNGDSHIDTPLRQGAGLIQVYDALTQHIHVSPAQISFNDTSSNKYKSHTLTLTNNGNTTVAYAISNNVSLAVVPYNLAKFGYGYQSPINYSTDAASLRLSKKTIKVAAGKSVKINVKVSPPKTDPKEHIMYGGYVQFKATTPSTPDVTVPYFGIVGRQKDLPIFDEGTPFLSNDAQGDSTIPNNQTIIIHSNANSNDSAVYIITRFVTPSPLFQAHVLDAKSGKVVGAAVPDQPFTPRNTFKPDNQIDVFGFDGTVYSATGSQAKAKPLPKGTYVLKLQALHMFGNPKKTSDWDSWTSGKIQIQ
ncbi:subtilisin-like protein [Hesseltinella vesiculosa]|uniref:Subtilisin-like protein n=1 Tax=Hesseltinella vesiculosa TaxID=101127 RepID=A0A1X2G9C2_9FUNG|nr:subtilisin-like protein [Hesseltinella vesiculosa]